MTKPENQNRLQFSLLLIGTGCVGVLCFLVLIGWSQNISIFKTLLPGRPDMKANTAIGLLITSVSIWLFSSRPLSRRSRWIGQGLASFVSVFSILVLVQYLFKVNLGIDELIFVDPVREGGHSPPGRFSPVTAINFVLISVALLLDSKAKPWHRTSQILVSLTFLVSFQAFFGSILGMERAFGINLFIPMAVHTSLSFTLLSVSFFAMRANVGFMSRFVSSTPSAVMARRMLIAIVLIPPFIRGLASRGAEVGLYSEGLTNFLQVTGTLLFMSIIVTATAGALERIELERERLRKREQKAFQEARSERDKLHRIFYQAPTHVDMYRGPEHRFELAHPHTVELANGRTLLGQRLRDVFPDSITNGVIESADHVYMTGEPIETSEVAVRFEKSPGVFDTRFFHTSIQAWHDSEGAIEGVIIFSIDITDEVRARQLIEESREQARRNADQLRLITDALPSLVSYIDSEQRYRMVNAAYQKWYGHPKSFFLGKKVQDAHVTENYETAKEWMFRALKGEQVHFQGLAIDQYGQNLFVDSTLIPDLDEKGKTRGLIVLRHDITQAQKDQLELKRAKEEAEAASLAKSQFLANMSHEIRTPLGVILGFSELGVEAIDRPAEIKEYLTSIRRNAESLSKLLGEILDLSKVEAKKLEIEEIEVSIKRLVEDVRSLFAPQAESKSLRFEIHFDPSVDSFEGRVLTDPTRLRQILVNLVGNAIKFTQEGFVRLKVSISLLNSKHGESEKDKTLGELKFHVEDSGIGISGVQRSRLFEAFSQADSSMTRKFGGTGLGLILSRELARALGGDLRLIDSTVGQGSRFEATIRAQIFEKAQQLPAISPFDSNSAKPIFQNFIVLLVEDSPDNQILVSRYLKETGIRLEIAKNGHEGLDQSEKCRPNLILMDIQMPGMDGFEVTRLLRSQGFTQPIVALTANAVRAEREKALKSGFNEYLTKPINRNHLIETIQKFYDQQILTSSLKGM